MQIIDNYILYQSFDGQGIIDNPYALFKSFINRKDFFNYVHIWVVDDYDRKWYQIMEFSSYSNIRFVKYGTDEYLYYLSVSKYLINNCTFPSYFTKKNNQVYINTWHGKTIKKLGYDVPNSKLFIGNTIRNFLSCDYILSSDKDMTEVYRKSYKLDGIFNGKIIEEGQPRNDLNYTNKMYVINKLKSYGIEIEKHKKVILYAPTWGENKTDFDSIIKCVDKSKYQLLCKSHHVDYKKINPMFHVIWMQMN